MSRFFYPLKPGLFLTVLILMGGCESDTGTPSPRQESPQLGQTPASAPHVAESHQAPTANVPKGEAWTDAERLANRGSGRQALIGGGESMNPLYGDGTMLVIHPIDYDQLKEGMVVVYLGSSGRRVAHRLLRKEAKGWVAKGDNNGWEDKDRVTRENLIGVVYANLFSQ